MGIKFKRKISIAAILFIILLICCFLPKIVQRTNRFGYFVDGPRMKYLHSNADILTMEDGNILIIGTNHNYPYNKVSNSQIKIPFEVYNSKNNKFKQFNIIDDSILYLPKGILLKNNKLLLTYVKNNKENTSSDTIRNKSHFYDSMALVNLKTKQIENIISKQISKVSLQNEIPIIQRLNNENIVLLSGNFMEIYNKNNKTTTLLNFKINKHFPHIIPYGEAQALIFGEDIVSDQKITQMFYRSMDSVLLYDDTSRTLKNVGQVLRRENPYYIKLNNDKILIIGGQINLATKNYNKVKEIELYDINEHTSKIIAKLNVERKYKYPGNISGIDIDKNHCLILGGYSGQPPLDFHRRTTEIIDLDNGNVFNGPQLPYAIGNASLIKLNNGNFLIISTSNLGKKTILFNSYVGRIY